MTTIRKSNAELADAYARAAQVAKAAEKAADALKKQVRERMAALGQDTISGCEFNVTLTRSLRETLDQNTVRTLLTPDEIVACTRQTPVATLNYYLRDEVISGFNQEEAA